MRIIVAGSRTGWVGATHIEDALADRGWTMALLLCGMAAGVDACAWLWAKSRGIPIEEYPADWQAYGLRAGPIRNEQMAANADALLAFPGPRSRGTIDIIARARKRGLPVEVRR